MTTRRHIGVDPLAVSIDEASELLSISRGKVYELIARGEFAKPAAVDPLKNQYRRRAAHR